MSRPMIPPRRYDTSAPRVIPTTGAVVLRPISFPTVMPPMVPAITSRSLNTSTKITLCRLTLTMRPSTFQATDRHSACWRHSHVRSHVVRGLVR